MFVSNFREAGMVLFTQTTVEFYDKHCDRLRIVRILFLGFGVHGEQAEK